MRTPLKSQAWSLAGRTCRYQATRSSSFSLMTDSCLQLKDKIQTRIYSSYIKEFFWLFKKPHQLFFSMFILKLRIVPGNLFIYGVISTMINEFTLNSIIKKKIKSKHIFNIKRRFKLFLTFLATHKNLKIRLLKNDIETKICMITLFHV